MSALLASATLFLKADVERLTSLSVTRLAGWIGAPFYRVRSAVFACDSLSSTKVSSQNVWGDVPQGVRTPGLLITPNPNQVSKSWSDASWERAHSLMRRLPPLWLLSKSQAMSGSLKCNVYAVRRLCFSGVFLHAHHAPSPALLLLLNYFQPWGVCIPAVACLTGRLGPPYIHVLDKGLISECLDVWGNVPQGVRTPGPSEGLLITPDPNQASKSCANASWQRVHSSTRRLPPPWHLSKLQATPGSSRCSVYAIRRLSLSAAPFSIPSLPSPPALLFLLPW
ncbi:hypothetical protein JB92DRAFT_3130561 [Gautieria morchelliformis]|nr:hypothetical protein JB92DRAFT_3130561 [Gautieria morchelliformis]